MGGKKKTIKRKKKVLESPGILKSQYFIAGDPLGSLLVLQVRKLVTAKGQKSQKWFLLIDQAFCPQQDTSCCSTCDNERTGMEGGLLTAQYPTQARCVFKRQNEHCKRFC